MLDTVYSDTASFMCIRLYSKIKINNSNIFILLGITKILKNIKKYITTETEFPLGVQF